MVYFGSGHRDPDPAVYPGSEGAIDGWLNIIDVLYSSTGLRIMQLCHGRWSQKNGISSLTRLRKEQIDRTGGECWPGDFTSLSMGAFYATPVSFGKLFLESDLRAPAEWKPAREPSSITVTLYRDHIREFNSPILDGKSSLSSLLLHNELSFFSSEFGLQSKVINITLFGESCEHSGH